MATSWKRWGVALAKALFALALLAYVALQFRRELTKPDDAGRLPLENVEWHPGWLALSAGLYLVFMASSCVYWRRLLLHFGFAPGPLVCLRAYFVSQFGKYVPGKAWALIIRGVLVRGPKLRMGLAIVTTFYEVLTTMAAGAMLATIIFVVQPPARLELRVPPALTGLLLLAACAAPLLPAVFNRIAARLARRLQTEETGPPPRIDLKTLVQGLAIIGCGWLVLGVSVWAGLASVLPEPKPLNLEWWLRCLGAMGLAYVGGFLVPFLPGGVGAREYLLLRLLAGEGPEGGLFAAAVLLMRVAWTIAELGLAGLLYYFGPSAAGANVMDQTEPPA